MSADAVDIIETPLDLFAQWNKLLLDNLIQRFGIKLWILQKIEQQLQIAVACTTPDTIDRGIQQIYPIDNGLLGI